MPKKPLFAIYFALKTPDFGAILGVFSKSQDFWSFQNWFKNEDLVQNKNEIIFKKKNNILKKLNIPLIIFLKYFSFNEIK